MFFFPFFVKTVIYVSSFKKFALHSFSIQKVEQDILDTASYQGRTQKQRSSMDSYTWTY